MCRVFGWLSQCRFNLLIIFVSIASKPAHCFTSVFATINLIWRTTIMLFIHHSPVRMDYNECYINISTNWFYRIYFYTLYHKNPLHSQLQSGEMQYFKQVFISTVPFANYFAMVSNVVWITVTKYRLQKLILPYFLPNLFIRRLWCWCFFSRIIF